MSNTGLIGGLAGGLSQILQAAAPIGLPLAQQAIASSLRQPLTAMPVSSGGAFVASGQPLGTTQGFDPRFAQRVDLNPFNDDTGDLTSPFRQTAAGTQVAKPYVAVKDNGKTEWFIPAGQPTGFSKATRKRRKCPTRCAPARRRRRPR